MKIWKIEDTGVIVTRKRTIKFELPDAPIIFQDYTVRRRRAGNQTRTRRYQLHHVSMFKKDDEKWGMSVYVNQLRADGAPAKRGIIAIRRFAGYELQNNATVKDIRTAVIKEMGIGPDDVDPWGFHTTEDDFV